MNLRLIIVFFLFNTIFFINGISQKNSQSDNVRIFEILNDKYGFVQNQWTSPVIVANDTVAFIYNFKNGFAVVSNDKQFYPLKAFSNTPLVKESEKYHLWVEFLQKDYFYKKN